MQDGLPARLAKLLDVVTGYVLILIEQDARLVPLAQRPELDLADDGVKFGLMSVFGELLLIDAAHRFERLLDHLHLGIGVGREQMAEYVDAFGPGARRIALEKLLNAGEVHGLRRQINIVADNA